MTDSSSTIIDIIYVNNASESNIFARNILSQISDHLPQFAILSEDALDYKTSSYFAYKYFDYKYLDKVKFLADYKEIETSFIGSDNMDVNGKFDTFLSSLHNLINKHFPQRKLSKMALKLKSKPWVNSKILRRMKIRDNLFQLFKSTKSAGDLKVNKLFRNRVVNESRESKKTIIVMDSLWTLLFYYSLLYTGLAEGKVHVTFRYTRVSFLIFTVLHCRQT